MFHDITWYHIKHDIIWYYIYHYVIWYYMYHDILYYMYMTLIYLFQLRNLVADVFELSSDVCLSWLMNVWYYFILSVCIVSKKHIQRSLDNICILLCRWSWLLCNWYDLPPTSSPLDCLLSHYTRRRRHCIDMGPRNVYSQLKGRIGFLKGIPPATWTFRPLSRLYKGVSMINTSLRSNELY